MNKQIEPRALILMSEQVALINKPKLSLGAISRPIILG